MRKIFRNKKMTAGILALLLAVSSAAPAVHADEGNGGIVKEETVFVKALPNGAPYSVIVSDWLKGAGAQPGELKDESSLSDIINVKGDETFTREGKEIVWETAGKDIFYQGSTDAALPVGVNMHWYLNDEETAPEDLAGKSGHVRLVISYENNTVNTGKIGGEEEKVASPVIMLTAMILPDEKFHGITVDHGRVISDSSRSIVVGLGMPGANRSLGIEEENEMGFLLPEGFTVEADTDGFSFGGTLTVALADLTDLLDEGGMSGGVGSLTEKMSGMLETAGSLLADAGTISDSLDSDIVTPAGQLMSDAETLQEKITGIAGEIRDAKKTLKQQAQANLDAAAAKADEQIDAANLLIAECVQGAADQANAELAEARKALDEQIETLKAAGEDENAAAIAALVAAKDALKDIEPAQTKELSHLDVPAVKAPALTVDTAGLSLLLIRIGLEYTGVKQAADTLLAKVDTMKTGLDSLLTDGQTDLTGLIGNMLDRARLMADESGRLDNFSGKAEEMEGSVKFLIETDPIG